jgi:hypothetical protein
VVVVEDERLARGPDAVEQAGIAAGDDVLLTGGGPNGELARRRVLEPQRRVLGADDAGGQVDGPLQDFLEAVRARELALPQW